MKCANCGRSFIPKHPSQKFCTHKGAGNCKDNYHNKTNPRGIYAHLANDRTDLFDEGDKHPFEDIDIPC
jgi:uncharacterized OB-fold protein